MGGWRCRGLTSDGEPQRTCLRRRSNQAARSPGPTSPTHLCKDASSGVLSAVACAKQSYMRESVREKKNNNNSALTSFCLPVSPPSLCFSFSPLFLRYQRLQSPPMVSGSQTFPVDLDRCKQTPLSRNVGSHLQAFLARAVSLLRSRHTPMDVTPGMQSAYTPKLTTRQWN